MNTYYSCDDCLDILKNDPRVDDLVSYILWDTSTEHMQVFGLPTKGDVIGWIAVLELRPDSDSEPVKRAINDCHEYIDLFNTST